MPFLNIIYMYWILYCTPCFASYPSIWYILYSLSSEICCCNIKFHGCWIFPILRLMFCMHYWCERHIASYVHLDHITIHMYRSHVHVHVL
jgi:hypothetical protein